MLISRFRDLTAVRGCQAFAIQSRVSPTLSSVFWLDILPWLLCYACYVYALPTSYLRPEIMLGDNFPPTIPNRRAKERHMTSALSSRSKPQNLVFHKYLTHRPSRREVTLYSCVDEIQAFSNTSPYSANTSPPPESNTRPAKIFNCVFVH